MRQLFLLLTILFCGSVTLVLAQADPLQGRWEGTVQLLQGDRPAIATFRKEGATYVGSVSGLRGNTAVPLSEIKLTGDKLTAKTVVESSQGTIVVNYDFTLQGETLSGKGEAEVAGQTFALTVNLKRVSTEVTQNPMPTPAAPQTPAPAQPQAPTGAAPPQPKQSLDFFSGSWQFKWTGRESPLGPGGTREGSLTLVPLDRNFLTGQILVKAGAVLDRDSWLVGFDAANQVLVILEQRSNGPMALHLGDWSSPLRIQFNIAPLVVNGQKLRLKRTLAILSPHSFSLTEELAEDDGPFVRLGQGVYSKVPTTATKD